MCPSASLPTRLALPDASTRDAQQRIALAIQRAEVLMQHSHTLLRRATAARAEVSEAHLIADHLHSVT
jgi:hypothetical protein